MINGIRDIWMSTYKQQNVLTQTYIEHWSELNQQVLEKVYKLGVKQDY